jgi:hypothetical protein
MNTVIHPQGDSQASKKAGEFRTEACATPRIALVAFKNARLSDVTGRELEVPMTIARINLLVRPPLILLNMGSCTVESAVVFDSRADSQYCSPLSSPLPWPPRPRAT